MSVICPRPQTPRCFEEFPRDSPDIIVQVEPGLSGTGPVVFRGEDYIFDGHAGTLDFYDNVICSYKGKVEAWYSDKQDLGGYFTLIFLTVWVVCFPKSDLIWRVFYSLPAPLGNLRNELNSPY